MDNEPHVHDWRHHMLLAHAAPRCGAQARAGTCRQPAMPNGRCRFHGGKSTGPRTAEGLERSKRARWQHGHYSAEARAARQEARDLAWALRYLGIILA